MDVRIEDSTSDYVFAHWDRVVLAVWRGKTTSSAVRRGELFFDQHATRCAGPVLLLTVIEPAAPLPPLEARMELVAFLQRGAGRIERSALVFEGEGFRAASVRAVVAGMSLFSRPAYPHRVFSSVGNAARFLAGGKSGSPAPHLLIRAMRDARQRAGTSTFVPWIPVPPQPGAPLRRQ
jgi:hypothetical protein